MFSVTYQRHIIIVYCLSFVFLFFLGSVIHAGSLFDIKSIQTYETRPGTMLPYLNVDVSYDGISQSQGFTLHVRPYFKKTQLTMLNTTSVPIQSPGKGKTTLVIYNERTKRIPITTLLISIKDSNGKTIAVKQKYVHYVFQSASEPWD